MKSIAVVGCLFSAVFALGAHAAWPERTVTIIVPFAAGGSTDNIARISAEWLGRALRHSFIVENRVGASGAIASEYVANAAADGHTLFMASVAQLMIVPQMQKVRYDTFKSFAPISVVSTSAFALAVNSDFPVRTLAELVAYAKARPGQVPYASAGNGSASHLTMALFLRRAGITMSHVPYKGVAPAVQDLLGGHVPIIFGSTSEVLRPYKAGKLKLVAVSSEKRLSQLSEVPTVAEQGFPGYSTTTWNGLLAPAGTSRDVISMIAEALRPACRDSGFTAKLQAIDADPLCNTPGQFSEMLQAEWLKWGEAVKTAGAALN